MPASSFWPNSRRSTPAGRTWTWSPVSSSAFTRRANEVCSGLIRPCRGLLLLRSLGGLFLFGPGSREQSRHAIVALVAGVLEDRPLGPDARNLSGPRPGERRRVIDREGIQERLGIGAREAFHQVQILAGPP